MECICSLKYYSYINTYSVVGVVDDVSCEVSVAAQKKVVLMDKNNIISYNFIRKPSFLVVVRDIYRIYCRIR